MAHLADHLTIPPQWVDDNDVTVCEETQHEGSGSSVDTRLLKRELHEGEKAALSEVMSDAYVKLVGLPIRAEVIHLLSHRFKVEIPDGKERVIKAELKSVRTQLYSGNPMPTRVKAEEVSPGEYVDVVTGETIVID